MIQPEIKSPPRPKSILENQIGAVIDVYPTEPNEQVIVRILEEAFTDDPPGVRTAKWIDELPDAPSVQPQSILPELNEKTLRNSLSDLRSHWAAFQQRCPRTSAFYRERGIEPQIETVIGDDDIQNHIDSVWERLQLVNSELDFPTEDATHQKASPREAKRFLTELLNQLVLIDFLYARGGTVGRELGHHACRAIWIPLSLKILYVADDLQLAIDASLELLWPHMEASGLGASGVMTVAGIFPKDSRERLSFGKWLINQKVEIPDDKRMGTFVNRENAYYSAEDWGGELVMIHAVYPDGNFKTIKPVFLKRFGPQRGEENFQEYKTAIQSRKSTGDK